jgi:hypothetical protein
MRGVPLLAAAVIGAAAVLSGCGQQHPATGPAAPKPPSGSSSAVSVACGGRPVAHGKLTITGADSGASFCVTRGTNVTVFLKGTPARKWAPIKASSSVLRPSANGELALALGVTGASFAAARLGTVAITSSRPACGRSSPPGDGAAGTGTLSCQAILAFRATVTVVS